MDETIRPVFEVRREKMANSKYSIIVWPYLMGQLRIQLCSEEESDLAGDSHNEIVREMCTYKHATMLRKVTELAMSENPEALAESWATPKNCDVPKRGRIRLDSI